MNILRQLVSHAVLLIMNTVDRSSAEEAQLLFIVFRFHCREAKELAPGSPHLCFFQPHLFSTAKPLSNSGYPQYMNAEILACDYRALRLYQSLCVVVLLFYVVSPAASQLLNLSIPLTSPSLVYTPFVCNATEVSLNPAVCEGGW